MELKDLNILVTGADGFIGSHLTEMLVQKSNKVKALSQYNSFNYWGWLEHIENLDKIEVLNGDIRDKNYCVQITKDIDIIFHMAALIAIPYSYIAPASYVDVNIKGTLNICQAAAENSCKKIIHTSTSEVYGTALYIPIDEKHPKQPQSPYSASKIGADALAMSFNHSFGLPIVIARPFNTYGPRQSARAIIPTIITQIANGAKYIKLGDLRPTRDFNFVKDTCMGLILLAESDEVIGKEVNICSQKEISIKALLELIKNIMNADIDFIEDNKRLRPDNSEVLRLCGDNGLIKKLTGYTPKYSLKEGLKETIDWLCKPSNLSSYKCDIYNV